MAANSRILERNGKQNTTSASPEELLEQFQQAVKNLAHIGIGVRVANSVREENVVVLALSGAQWCPTCKTLRPFEQMDADAKTCQHCAAAGASTEAGAKGAK